MVWLAIVVGSAASVTLLLHKANDRVTSKKRCRENIAALYAAHQRWFAEQFGDQEAGIELPTPRVDDLVPLYLSEVPRCPLGYEYELTHGTDRLSVEMHYPGHPICESGDEEHRVVLRSGNRYRLEVFMVSMSEYLEDVF